MSVKVRLGLAGETINARNDQVKSLTLASPYRDQEYPLRFKLVGHDTEVQITGATLRDLYSIITNEREKTEAALEIRRNGKECPLSYPLAP